MDPTIKILWLDTDSFFESVVAEATTEGLIVDEPCHKLGSWECEDPTRYLFIDRVHWTSYVHRLFADYAASKIMETFQSESVIS